jgi:hypothetical protein
MIYCRSSFPWFVPLVFVHLLTRHDTFKLYLLNTPLTTFRDCYTSKLHHKFAFPFGSYGRIALSNPAAKNSAPLTYTGAAVLIFA